MKWFSIRKMCQLRTPQSDRVVLHHGSTSWRAIEMEIKKNSLFLIHIMDCRRHFFFTNIKSEHTSYKFFYFSSKTVLSLLDDTCSCLYVILISD